jgi:hypothetical protein
MRRWSHLGRPHLPGPSSCVVSAPGFTWCLPKWHLVMRNIVPYSTFPVVLEPGQNPTSRTQNRDSLGSRELNARNMKYYLQGYLIRLYLIFRKLSLKLSFIYHFDIY